MNGKVQNILQVVSISLTSVQKQTLGLSGASPTSGTVANRTLTETLTLHMLNTQALWAADKLHVDAGSSKLQTCPLFCTVTLRFCLCL